ncbi:MAG: hydroxyacylglutathione hydrolase [Burkholderiales bacterium]|nr:hydroxyacylglutathione hydrolase [Burkholderiales bacterium]
MAVDVIPLRAFRDNYIWCLRDAAHAAVVDPGDAGPVMQYLEAERLRLVAILATHHHADHVGGVAQLAAEYSAPVYGPARESIPAITQPLREGDRVRIAELDLDFGVLDIPGHTAGHIALVGAGMLFCGDTLFSVGCGRLFEGTPAQMSASLAKLGALPGPTRVYCGHEYTAANIRFAQAVEPGNETLVRRERETRTALASGRPSLPSTIADERETNPFLRTRVPGVAASAARHAGRALPDPVEVFAVLREWKNQF